jgi:hypothetical protein
MELAGETREKGALRGSNYSTTQVDIDIGLYMTSGNINLQLGTFAFSELLATPR